MDIQYPFVSAISYPVLESGFITTESYGRRARKATKRGSGGN
jgi:hypothetical protein